MLLRSLIKECKMVMWSAHPKILKSWELHGIRPEILIRQCQLLRLLHKRRTRVIYRPGLQVFISIWEEIRMLTERRLEPLGREELNALTLII